MSLSAPRIENPTVERGFTLVEVLVALSVLSIGVLALLNVQGESAVTASAVRDRLLAEIAAENVLVETLSGPEEIPAGVVSGESVVAGQAWAWTQTVTSTSDRDIKRVDVVVRKPQVPAPMAAVVAFRGQK